MCAGRVTEYLHGRKRLRHDETRRTPDLCGAVLTCEQLRMLFMFHFGRQSGRMERLLHGAMRVPMKKVFGAILLVCSSPPPCLRRVDLCRALGPARQFSRVSRCARRGEGNACEPASHLRALRFCRRLRDMRPVLEFDRIFKEIFPGDLRPFSGAGQS